VPLICGYGSEWDARRGQTKFWVELDNGAGYAGYGDRLPAARLDLLEQLRDLELPLSELGPYGDELVRDTEAWTRQVARFPGGRAAEPPYDFTRAMKNGAPLTVEFLEGPSHGTIAVEKAGTLELGTGRLFAGAPHSPREPVLERQVKPGRYPVFVSWAEIAGEPRRRSVLAWIRFSDEPVTRWEQALAEGQDVAELEPGDMFGCGIDSGCACFADPDDAGQCISFTSGWGDGQYACYWGYGQSGAEAVLVMDVELVSTLSD
jgi:hypothetical protein